MNKITFKYLTLELIEKIIRLKSYITKNNSKGDNNSNQAVIEIFNKVLTSLQSYVDSIIQDINDLDEDYTDDEVFAIQRNISQCYTTIKELHKELHFLSTDWLKLETYTFVEQLHEKYFKIDANSKKLNIILSDDYTFIETNLDKRFEKITLSFHIVSDSFVTDESPSVIIPKMEYSNPLNWTILVHELCHSDRENITKLCSDSNMYPEDLSPSEKEKLEFWAEEIYCDLIAIQIIGPAYFLSLTSFAILESLVIGLGVSSNSHPPFAMRLALLYYYIDKNHLEISASLPNGKEGTIHSFIYSMTEIINNNIKKINKTLRKEPEIKDLMIFYQFLRNELIKDEQSAKDITPIIDLVKDISEMIPIGSYRSHVSDKEYLKMLESTELSNIDFNSIKNSLTERNSELWEIINAGWIYKIQEIIPLGLRLFFDTPGKSIFKKTEEYSTSLDLLDDRMLVSIETSKLIDLIEK